MKNIIRVLLLVGVAGCVGCTKSSSVLQPTGDAPGDPLLAITSVTPSAGFAAINTPVTIVGTGFKVGATVTIGGARVLVTSNAGTVLRTSAPAHSEGPVDVVVANPTGPSVTLAGGFTYQAVTLTANPGALNSGASLTVSWTAPSGRSTMDWIGLFKVTAPSTSYEDGWWDYTNGHPTGSFTIAAPFPPGAYEFRYLLDDGYVDVARSAVTVMP